MEQRNIYFRKVRRIVMCLASLFCILSIFTTAPANAANQHYYYRTIRTGDTIYFDNYDTNWSDIRVHIFNNDTNTPLFSWRSDEEKMEYVSGSIYKYTIKEAYNVDSGGYNSLVFSGLDWQSTVRQTADLLFVGSGYAYNANSGSWYLYDTSEVTFKEVRAISNGDVIYYDDSFTSWGNNPHIYMFSKVGGTEYSPWNGPAMTPIGNNIYRYPAGSDITSHNDDYIVFSNNAGNSQTIDLGFLGTGYAYKVESWDNNRGVGYWYVYDKNFIKDLADEAESYLSQLKCLPASSYASVTRAISDARNVVNTANVPVEDQNFNGTTRYWTQADVEYNNLKTKLNNLKNIYGDTPTICTVAPTITKTITNPKSYYQAGDTVGFRIDVVNTASISLSSLDVTEYLSGASFIAGAGYSVINSQLARTDSIGAGDTVSIYAEYTINTDITTQYTNTATITAVIPSDSNYSWDTSSVHSGAATFDTRSQDPVPTGVDNNSATFTVVLLSSISILAVSSYINARRHT